MKDSGRSDRRVVRTRTLISDAMLKLLHHTAFEDITIVDIAEQADVNRSTFYAHFIDKDDLMERMTREQLEDLHAVLRRLQTRKPYVPSFDAADPIFSALFEHAFRHSAFYRVMLLHTNAGLFRVKLTEWVRTCFFDRQSGLPPEQKLEVPLDILLDSVSYSTVGVLERWLADNLVYSPAHMSLQLTRTSVLGAYKAMGITDESVL